MRRRTRGRAACFVSYVRVCAARRPRLGGRGRPRRPYHGLAQNKRFGGVCRARGSKLSRRCLRTARRPNKHSWRHSGRSLAVIRACPRYFVRVKSAKMRRGAGPRNRQQSSSRGRAAPSTPAKPLPPHRKIFKTGISAIDRGQNSPFVLLQHVRGQKRAPANSS